MLDNSPCLLTTYSRKSGQSWVRRDIHTDWLDKNVMLELDALTDSEAKLFVNIIMSQTYRKEHQQGGFQHVSVIEETHNVLKKETESVEAKSVMDKIFRDDFLDNKGYHCLLFTFQFQYNLHSHLLAPFFWVLFHRSLTADGFFVSDYFWKGTFPRFAILIRGLKSDIIGNRK